MAVFTAILAISLSLCAVTDAADPAPLQDYCVADTSATIYVNGLPCMPPSKAQPAHFVTSVLANPTNTTVYSLKFNSAFASAASTLPGLNTLGLTMARSDFAVGGMTPPHVHPRATEVVYMVEGSVDFGFVDTNNTLFNGTAKKGDVFVVPQGLVHYVVNGGNVNAFALVAFTSQNPGVVLVPSASFASTPGIPVGVLSKSFHMSEAEVAHIRRSLGGS